MTASTQKSSAKANSAPTTRRAPVRGLSMRGAGGVADAMAKLHASGGNYAVNAMLRGGFALPRETRDELEQRFGADFSDVRIHSDGAAHASAAAMHANAYTFGRDIVFGANRFAPQSPSGKRLLAHEIAHVVQQRRGGAAPVLSSNAAHEHGADTAAHAFVGGQGVVAVQGATAVGVARDESDKKEPTDSLGEVGDIVVDAVASAVAGDSPFERRVVAAAMRGFITEMRTQLVDQDKAARFQERMLELLNPGTMAAYAGSYVAGLAAGFVSPVTDLFGLPAFVDAVGDFVKEAAKSIVEHAPELLAEGYTIAAQFSKLQDEMVAALAEIMTEQAKDPRYLSKMAEAFGDKAVQMAGRMGHGAAAEAIHLFESPWEEDKEQDPGWKSVLPKDLGDVVANPSWAALATGSRVWEYGTERLKKKIFSSGWSKIGYAIGHVVGAVIANVLLLVFTEGIGNAIAAIGGAIGKLGPALRSLGTFVTKIAEALKFVGGAIKAVEEGIALVAKTVLKPLERVLKPFGELLEVLQRWLKKLFGVAEKEGAELAATTGSKLAKLGDEAPKPTSHLDAPKVEPHVTPKADPHVTPKAEPQPKIEPKVEPKAEPKPKPKQKAKPKTAPTDQPKPEPKAKPKTKAKAKPKSKAKPKPPKAPKNKPAFKDPHGIRSDTTSFDHETAGTGGIKEISFGKDPDGLFSVKIKGELKEGMYRGKGKAPAGKTKAPNYNRSGKLISNKEAGLPAGDWENAHLWGPGFGDEAAAGMMKAPRSVNQWYQNEGIEGWMRDLRKAAPPGSTIDVEATAVAWDLKKGGWKPKAQPEFLKRAEYRVNVTTPGGEHVPVHVTIDVPHPPATGPINISIDPPGGANPADLLNIIRGTKKGAP